MKRSKLDELEGQQIERSYKLNENTVINKDMNENIKSVVDKLPEYLQERAKMLWDQLMRFNVRQGVANKLMGMGHMGAENDPIWKYIYKLQTERKISRIRDKGSWLVKCMLNDKFTSK